MKKTLTVLIMVLLAAMLIISCDNSTSEPKKEDSSTTPTETPTTPTTSTYTVTFDVNGGTGTVADKTTGTDGKVSKPGTNPKKTNAVFLYWSKDKSSEFKFDTVITENTTLYAVWKTEFSVGDVGPAGGTIFYINENYDASSTEEAKNWKYLEAAPEDLTYTDGEGNVSNTFIFGLNWSMATGYAQKQLCGTSGNSDGNGDNAKIGMGKANTATLVQKLGSYAGNSESNYMSNTPVYAAKLCDDYGKDTEYDDWFLPSLNELKELYSAYAAGKVGGTWHTVNTASLTGGQVDYYWSSSEYDESSAWAISFNNGWAGGSSRVGTGYDYVRPVRSF